jgi:transposase InsO family protein
MSKEKRQKKPNGATRPHGGPISYAQRLGIVREVLRGATQTDVGTAFGVSQDAVSKYLRLFRHGGVDALKLRLHGAAATAVAKARAKASRDPRRAQVVEARQEHPEWGTRRIRDVLARFAGLGVSETAVRRILHEEGLIPESPAETGPREHPERRFERAAPNQLWQSDIFTFLLRRQERLYVAAFLDDHSRYLVSFALAHHQKSSLVLEALERGVAQYGAPEEVLTDQGRQYTAWRGETEFEQWLRRQGIRHVKSRPQHPQTLGKIERFWKSLWDEFLSRTVCADFADCERRLALYVQHYNFQRPHQALCGLVPADRFFQAAPQVRAAVEQTVAANALRLAQAQPPRKPFYLVGRLGDQDLSIAAAGGGLKVRLGNAAQTIDFPKEDDHGARTSRNFQPEPEREQDHEQAPPAAPPDADLADRAHRPGSGGAAPLPDAAERALGGEAGEHGDRGAGHLAGGVLPARDQSAGGDAAGARAGRRWGDDGGRREHGAPGERAGDAGDAAGAGQAAAGAAAVPGAQGAAGGAGDAGAGATAEDGGPPELDERWAETFALLTAFDDEGGERGFEPDAGWRGRALTWERKLVSAAAPCDAGVSEGNDGAEAPTRGAAELPARTGGAGAGGGALPGDHRGAGGDALGERGRTAAGAGAQQLPDAGAPGAGGDGGEPAAAADGAEAEARAGGAAGDRSPAPVAGEDEADGAAGDDGPAAGDRERGDSGPAGETAPAAVAALLAELDALLDGRGGAGGAGGAGDSGAPGAGGAHA